MLLFQLLLIPIVIVSLCFWKKFTRSGFSHTRLEDNFGGTIELDNPMYLQTPHQPDNNHAPDDSVFNLYDQVTVFIIL